ncbi:sugar phosphate isomerase/epimerase family protein [Roseivirga sp.]|uniref:sugar phosphate isomerase/epimerase family protein n=1 Tax=Roseivirga sp. TaxID=1964215 RepID=UPI003B8B4044
MKRRDFIGKTSVATAGLMTAPGLVSKALEEDIVKSFGFQAYTVRDVIYDDMAGTLKTLRKAGFSYMELFDFQEGKILGKPIAEAKKIIEKSKLKVKSIHVPTGAADGQKVSGTMNIDFQRAVDDAAELGAEYLVCPYLTQGERTKIDQYKALAELLQKCGEMCQKSGLGFAYHNHEFEFEKLQGQIPYDIILETDPYYVKLELDMFWVRYAGLDPINLIRENAGRIPLWHVKDLSLDDGKKMTEVGNGIIDWPQLFRYQVESGMRYFYVEQDTNFANNSIESLKTGIKHLKKMKY